MCIFFRNVQREWCMRIHSKIFMQNSFRTEVSLQLFEKPYLSIISLLYAWISDSSLYAHYVFKAFDVNCNGAISFRVNIYSLIISYDLISFSLHWHIKLIGKVFFFTIEWNAFKSFQFWIFLYKSYLHSATINTSIFGFYNTPFPLSNCDSAFSNI